MAYFFLTGSWPTRSAKSLGTPGQRSALSFLGIVEVSVEIDAELEDVAVKSIAHGLVGACRASSTSKRGAGPADLDVEVIVEAVVATRRWK
jgi:hypothetical protein